MPVYLFIKNFLSYGTKKKTIKLLMIHNCKMSVWSPCGFNKILKLKFPKEESAPIIDDKKLLLASFSTLCLMLHILLYNSVAKTFIVTPYVDGLQKYAWH